MKKLSLLLVSLLVSCGLYGSMVNFAIDGTAALHALCTSMYVERDLEQARNFEIDLIAQAESGSQLDKENLAVFQKQYTQYSYGRSYKDCIHPAHIAKIAPFYLLGRQIAEFQSPGIITPIVDTVVGCIVIGGIGCAVYHNRSIQRAIKSIQTTDGLDLIEEVYEHERRARNERRTIYEALDKLKSK